MSHTELIEPGFLFSQHSLNTYVRCPRRFLLQYVDRQPWPVLEMDDRGERRQHLARGRLFHQWLVRQQLGLAMDPIVMATQDAQMRRWWEAAQSFAWASLPAARQLELPLVVPIGAYRLYARYDLVAWSSSSATIVDWKTVAERFSDPIAQARMQTRVYLYTLAQAGHVALGYQQRGPDQLSMHYWYVEFPAAPTVLGYSSEQYARDERYLSQLVAQISQQPRDAFVQTEHQQLCAACTYQGWCRRAPAGTVERPPDALDEDVDFDVDVASTPELEY